MCGITAFYDLAYGPTKASPALDSSDSVSPLQDQLLSSLSLLEHRGPDSRGTWISADGRVGLGHCRLAINDLRPSAAQPLHGSHGRVHAVVNGEIYDFDRLRAELQREYAYVFETECDSEVVVALYEVYGLEFTRFLRGEFAIVIYDADNQRFVAVRDRYGIKPLFYTVWQGRLVVAAEIKAFLGFGWKAQWDVQSLVEGGWNFDDRTVFKDVKKVRPGSMLLVEKGSMSCETYWELEFPDKRHPDARSEVDIIAGVQQHLLDAVRLRLRADVPVGVYLSGGIDSSAVAGMATHLIRENGATAGSQAASERVRCFSISFDKGSGYDESDIAKRTADWLGVEHHIQYMDEKALADRFEAAVWHCEHHNHDLNFIGKFALSELPREQGYKVVLTGEGADEIFAGYPLYLPDFLREGDDSWPDPKGQPSDAERQQMFAHAEKLTADTYHAIGADASNRAIAETQGLLNGISTPASMCAFQFGAFAPWARTVYTQDPQITISNMADESEKADSIRDKWHPLHSALYVWTKGHLVNNFLSCLGDRTEMAHSIEARPAFLDHVLTSYVNQIPPSLKIRWQRPLQKQIHGTALSEQFVEKYVLREAVRPFVTDEIYRRRKHPYTAPVTWARHGPLRSLFQALITEELVRNLGFVDWTSVSNIIDLAFDSGDLRAMRTCYIVGAWVVLSKRFGTPPATFPTYTSYQK